jgi:hypothetical protein
MSDAMLEVILDEVRELRKRVEQIYGEIGGIPEVQSVRNYAEAYARFLQQEASNEDREGRSRK